MDKYSVLDFKNFCKDNDVLEYRLESDSISEVMGCLCKVSLTFYSAIIADDFNIITLRDGNNSASLMCINEIIKMNSLDENIHLFTICCGIDNENKIFRLYIKINNKNKINPECKCIRCNNVFNTLDTYNGLKLKKTFGYGSKFDGEEIELNICINCLDEIVKGK